ncbi:hypothetical protein IEQ34_022163 [Dendrobium chrysotoxum]|uniref:F-box protein n=1 Tax=Dendrobium chrysotoxum TaxID=161865 RepID=A0AAV7FY32_DENCH|nr:hypothetical protein IEQ34_022163 [Dendrobium chrysotoxum]
MRMEALPVELCLNIFGFLDHPTLATALQGTLKIKLNLVCRKWKKAASDDAIWLKLFTVRWGEDLAEFFSSHHSKSWKEVYAIQHRCDRYGLGLKIITEGDDCYLIHQGEIQRHLGRWDGKNSKEEESCSEISDKILFFIGDLEVACAEAKRSPFF